MGLFEKKLNIRNVEFYFILNKDIPKEEVLLWQEAIKKSCLYDYFQRVEFEKYRIEKSSLLKNFKGWKVVKCFCTNSVLFIKPSKSDKFYLDIFKEFSEWFIDYCKNKSIDCKVYNLLKIWFFDLQRF